MVGHLPAIVIIVIAWLALGEQAIAQSTMYWTSEATTTIRQSNLDGSQVEALVPNDADDPNGLALDVAGGKMYWTDFHAAKIQRANLDGSGVEDLVTTGVVSPSAIALDVTAGKMYWTDFDAKKIQRANLNGSQVEDVVTGLPSPPLALALDTALGRMFWSDFDTNKLRRANLDGTGVRELETIGAADFDGLALDMAGGKIYWTDFDAAKIQRANFNGTNVEDLISTGLVSPVAIALDVAGGKIYWSDFHAAKIQRANLDGSQVDELVTDLASSPLAVALAIDHPSCSSSFAPQGVAATPLKFVHKVRTAGDAIVDVVFVRNLDSTVRNADVALDLWLSDNVTLSGDDALLAQRVVSCGTLGPGQQMRVKFKERDLDNIDGKFAIVTVHHGNAIGPADQPLTTLVKRIGGRGCIKDKARYEIEPNTPDSPRSVGGIRPTDCLTIEGAIGDESDIDGHQLKVKGEQTFDVILTHSSDVQFRLDVLDSVSGTLDCATSTACTVTISTLDETGIAEVRVTVVPVQGTGEYTIDLFSQEITTPSNTVTLAGNGITVSDGTASSRDFTVDTITGGIATLRHSEIAFDHDTVQLQLAHQGFSGFGAVLISEQFTLCAYDAAVAGCSTTDLRSFTATLNNVVVNNTGFNGDVTVDLNGATVDFTGTRRDGGTLTLATAFNALTAGFSVVGSSTVIFTPQLFLNALIAAQADLGNVLGAMVLIPPDGTQDFKFSLGVGVDLTLAPALASQTGSPINPATGTPQTNTCTTANRVANNCQNVSRIEGVITLR